MGEGDSSSEVYPLGKEESSLRQLEEEMNNVKASVRELSAKLDEQNRRKCDVKNELQQLRQRIGSQGGDDALQKLIPLLKSSKELERQESESQSNCDAKHSALEADFVRLEDKVAMAYDSDNHVDDLSDSLVESSDRLTSAKKELAAKLREIVSLKRQLDDVPCQSELAQYERRFSELNVCIQEKLQQTRKLYATYNALLEIKELMLKETSLLNSISSQFQDVITSPAGRVKLIDSMEGVVKGSQQKLEKVQLGLQEEQKLCDTSKDKYAAAVTEQRRCYSLLKTFHEECAKNERLRSRKSSMEASDSKGGIK